MRFFTLLMILMSMPLLSPLMAADQLKGEEIYRQAVKEIRADNYQHALKLLDAAQQAGYEESKLYYNRGVVLYKLARYQEAKQAFEQAGDFALVIYNLGLVNYRLGDKQAAKIHFLQVQQQAPDSQLASMSQRMINSIEGTAAKKTVDTPWSAFVDLSLGYDDNVTLENTELAQASNKEDSYWDFYASGKYRLQGDRKNGLNIGVAIAATRYQTQDTYDYSQYEVSLIKDAPLGDWQTRLSAKLARTDLGGSEYMQKMTFRAQTSTVIGETQRVRAYYDLTLYDELDAAYYYLAGVRHKIKLDTRWKQGDVKYRVGYDFEFNDRDDATSYTTPPMPKLNFTSYSATRHSLMAEVILPLAKLLTGSLGADYRISSYNDPDVVAGVVGDTRKDDRYRLKGGVDYRLNSQWRVVSNYTYTDNSSNDPGRSYQRNQFEVGLQGVF